MSKLPNSEGKGLAHVLYQSQVTQSPTLHTEADRFSKHSCCHVLICILAAGADKLQDQLSWAKESEWQLEYGTHLLRNPPYYFFVESRRPN
jgi:hypothetical protein